jgi:hypothetical protein
MFLDMLRHSQKSLAHRDRRTLFCALFTLKIQVLCRIWGI